MLHNQWRYYLHKILLKEGVKNYITKNIFYFVNAERFSIIPYYYVYNCTKNNQ